MSIEYAAGHHDYRRAALRNAPAWVRRKLGLDDHEDDNRAGETASHFDPPPGPPPHAWSAAGRGRSGGGTRLTWDPDSPHRPGAITARVWLVAAHGDASARSIRSDRPETIAPRAFGTAAALNREGLVPLVGLGHSGFPLARLSRGLVAHDTDVGLVLRWQPDLGNIMHRQAVEKIERDRWGCSVKFTSTPRNLSRLPSVDVVTKALLHHVALVEHPAYRGAIAMIFRQSHIADDREIAEQLARVVREAKFAARRTWGTCA